MILHLKRLEKTKLYTMGKLYINHLYFCDTIEDTVRVLNSSKDKIYGKTSIPAGQYRVVLTLSPRFKRLLPLILDVPYFEGIRIHSGNTADDSMGCILVGEYVGNGYIKNSRKIENMLVDILEKTDEDITIIISD